MASLPLIGWKLHTIWNKQGMNQKSQWIVRIQSGVDYKLIMPMTVMLGVGTQQSSHRTQSLILKPSWTSTMPSEAKWSCSQQVRPDPTSPLSSKDYQTTWMGIRSGRTWTQPKASRAGPRIKWVSWWHTPVWRETTRAKSSTSRIQRVPNRSFRMGRGITHRMRRTMNCWRISRTTIAWLSRIYSSATYSLWQMSRKLQAAISSWKT